MNISIDELSNVLDEELTMYSDEVTEGINKAVNVVAKECNEEIKNHITFKQPTGKYVKAFAIKTTTDSRYNKSKTWHVKGPYYRLTHILEKGHAKVGGGRTKAYPHIQYGEELALKRLPELCEEVIKNAGH